MRVKKRTQTLHRGNFKYRSKEAVNNATSCSTPNESIASCSSSSSSSPSSTSEPSCSKKYKRKLQSELPVLKRRRIQDSQYLRPIQDELNVTHFEQQYTNTQYDEENIILSLEALSKLLNSVAQLDVCMKHEVRPVLKSRQGLLIHMAARCDNCQIETEVIPMSKQLKHPGKRGPPASDLNERMTSAVLKSKIGPSDAVNMLAILNIKPPNNSIIYRKLNKQSEKTINFNEICMLENAILASNLSVGGVELETDTAYNNRPQTGFESGTQAVAPLIDTNTGLVLGCQTANKLCGKRACAHVNCNKNYKTEDSIASCETKLAKLHLNKMLQQNIKIKSITSDGSAQLAKTVREHSPLITHYICFIHKLRTLQKTIKNTKITSPLEKHMKRPIYQQQLASSMRRRVYSELIRTSRNVRDDKFVAVAHASIQNILSCFHNDHAACLSASRVCHAHLNTYNTNYLPYNKHLDLNQTDKITIQNILDKSFSFANLSKLSRGHHTNKSENLHHRVFTYAPKNTTYSRNFSGLCHSAMLSQTFGTWRSIHLFNKQLGLTNQISSPFHQHMVKQTLKSDRDHTRQSSLPAKTSRFFSRKSKYNRNVVLQTISNDAGTDSD